MSAKPSRSSGRGGASGGLRRRRTAGTRSERLPARAHPALLGVELRIVAARGQPSLDRTEEGRDPMRPVEAPPGKSAARAGRRRTQRRRGLEHEGAAGAVVLAASRATERRLPWRRPRARGDAARAPDRPPIARASPRRQPARLRRATVETFAATTVASTDTRKAGSPRSERPLPWSWC